MCTILFSAPEYVDTYVAWIAACTVLFWLSNDIFIFFFSMRWSMCVSIALAEVKLGFWILNLIVPMTSLSFLHEIEHVCLYRIGESQLGFGFWLSSPYFFLSFPNSRRRRRRFFLFFYFFISFESWLWRIVWCRCVADFGFHSLSTSGFFVFVPFWVEQKL